MTHASQSIFLMPLDELYAVEKRFEEVYAVLASCGPAATAIVQGDLDAIRTEISRRLSK